MKEFVWVLKEVVLAFHNEQLTEHGGLEGIRDEGMLESALSRPQNKVAYEKCKDAADLAASYAYGIIKNHPFVDGNKRVAFVTAELFLELNGYQLTAKDNDCILTILSVADGLLSEEDLVEWYRTNVKSL